MNLRLLIYMLVVLLYGLLLFFLLHSSKRTYFLLGCVGVVFFAMVIIDAWGIFNSELFPFSSDVWQATKYDFFGWGALFYVFIFINAYAKDRKDKREKEAQKQEVDSHKVIEITVSIDKGDSESTVKQND